MENLSRIEVLPQAFLARMREMLGDEYEEFLESYKKPRTYGLRVNTSKITCEEFEKLVPFPETRFHGQRTDTLDSEDIRPSRCPLYQAGLYYLQEPSAMTPAACLPVNPGESVLDLLRCSRRKSHGSWRSSEWSGASDRQ